MALDVCDTRIFGNSNCCCMQIICACVACIVDAIFMRSSSTHKQQSCMYNRIVESQSVVYCCVVTIMGGREGRTVSRRYDSFTTLLSFHTFRALSTHSGSIRSREHDVEPRFKIKYVQRA